MTEALTKASLTAQFETNLAETETMLKTARGFVCANADATLALGTTADRVTIRFMSPINMRTDVFVTATGAQRVAQNWNRRLTDKQAKGCRVRVITQHQMLTEYAAINREMIATLAAN